MPSRSTARRGRRSSGETVSVRPERDEERYHGVVELSSSGDPDVRARDVTVSATVKVVFALED